MKSPQTTVHTIILHQLKIRLRNTGANFPLDFLFTFLGEHLCSDYLEKTKLWKSLIYFSYQMLV